VQMLVKDFNQYNKKSSPNSNMTPHVREKAIPLKADKIKSSLYSGHRNMKLIDSSSIQSDLYEKSEGSQTRVQSKLK
jgi:hypothetical protein